MERCFEWAPEKEVAKRMAAESFIFSLMVQVAKPTSPIEFPFALLDDLCFTPCMSTMTAIYENGVFRPLGTVRLPEHTRVEIPIPETAPPPSDVALDAVYEALQFRFHSGTGDLASRHNEHQP